MDYERAAFVQQEYRFATSEDLSVLANYPNAVERIFNTQLNSTDATALASNLLENLKVPAIIYEVELDSMIMSDDLAGSLPRYNATFPAFNVANKTTKLISMETDFLSQRTTIRVRMRT